MSKLTEDHMQLWPHCPYLSEAPLIPQQPPPLLESLATPNILSQRQQSSSCLSKYHPNLHLPTFN
eukprot:1154081-Pelagomonas_calceolata.AAC.13